MLYSDVQWTAGRLVLPGADYNGRDWLTIVGEDPDALLVAAHAPGARISTVRLRQHYCPARYIVFRLRQTQRAPARYEAEEVLTFGARAAKLT